MNKNNLETIVNNIVGDAIVKEVMSLKLAVKLIEAVEDKAAEMGLAANLFLCFDRSIDCLIHVLKHSMHTGHTSGNLHIRHDLLYDVMYHAFIYRHFITSFNADAP